MVRETLIELAARNGTDKWGSHFYAQHYDTHFAPFRDRPIRLLEIGIGGYGDPQAGGQSLRMWRDYFPNAMIYGIDIADKSPHDEARIRTFQADQTDAARLAEIVADVGGIDLVVDDGSHVSQHVIASFRCLFPLLNDGGIYAIEDLETSYWTSFGGHSPRHNRSGSSMDVLKALADGLNFEELDAPGYQPSYTDRHVVSVHFYHSLCFIYKGRNDEGSIWVKNNVLNEAVRG